jgi:hypothetical protein
MDEATNHWIENRLIQMYTTHNIYEDIHFISTQYQFNRLNKGDLLYLNREWMQDNPKWDLPILIYKYLSYKTMDMYDESMFGNIHNFSDVAIKIMRIDANYWSMLTLPHVNSIDTAKSIRKKLIDVELAKYNRIIYIQSSVDIDSSLVIDCPVCLIENFKQSDCHQINCLHYLCQDCCNKIALKHTACCPLCRTKITEITTF